MPNEVVVALPSALSPQALDALARRHGLVRLQTESIGLTGTTFHRWRIADARSVSDVIRALEADGGVRTAQPNYRFTLQQGPATAAAPAPVQQYAVDKLDLAQAHRLATGTTCLIAVIDSGVDGAHPEIAAAIADRFDAVDPSAPPDNHGTAIAGAIAAHAQLTGVAPSARILAIRAFTKSESTTLAILKGIDWAVARGARVINMSFAGPQDPEIARALAAARRKGVLLVAAAGNAGPQSPPALPGRRSQRHRGDRHRCGRPAAESGEPPDATSRSRRPASISCCRRPAEATRSRRGLRSRRPMSAGSRRSCSSSSPDLRRTPQTTGIPPPPGPQAAGEIWGGLWAVPRGCLAACPGGAPGAASARWGRWPPADSSWWIWGARGDGPDPAHRAGDRTHHHGLGLDHVLAEAHALSIAPLVTPVAANRQSPFTMSSIS